MSNPDASYRTAARRDASHPATAQRFSNDEITTWGQFTMATAEQRRRWRDALLREWEENRAREVAEDDQADGHRGHWGD